MIDRRRFLQTTAAAMLGSVAFLPGCAGGKASGSMAGEVAIPASRLDRIGVQLYTLREAMAEDVSGTLANVAEIGFDEVEFAGYFDHTPAQIRALLDQNGLTSPATHISLQASQENLAEVIEAARTIGHRYVIVAYLLPPDRQSLDDYRRWANHFNEVGAACRDAGLQFAYHNHDFEFENFDGTLPYDLLLERTDAGLVQMELDLFWIAKAGHDPLAYFDAHPGRFPLCHVKDMTTAGVQVPVGEGDLDFANIFAHADEAGMRYFFVEQDNPADPLANVAQGYRHLAQLRF